MCELMLYELHWSYVVKQFCSQCFLRTLLRLRASLDKAWIALEVDIFFLRVICLPVFAVIVLLFFEFCMSS